MNIPPFLSLVDQDKLLHRLEKYAAHDQEMRAVFHGTLLSSLFMGSDAVSRSAQNWLIDATRLEIAVLYAFAVERVPIKVSMDGDATDPVKQGLLSEHGEQVLCDLVTKRLSDRLNPALASLIQVYVASGYMDLEAQKFALRGVPGNGTYLEAALFSRNANATWALMQAGARIERCPSSDLKIKTSSGWVAIGKGDYQSLLELSCGPGDPDGLRSAVEAGLRFQASQAMNEAIDAAAGHRHPVHRNPAATTRRRGI